MAERTDSSNRNAGKEFTNILTGLTGLKQSVDKSVRRTDDVLRKYNSAKMTDDGKERAAVLSKTQKPTAASVSKKDVSEAVSTANESTAKRLNELFGEVKTASAKQIVPSVKTVDAGEVESVKKIPVKADNKSDGKAAIAAAVTSAVAAGVAKAIPKKSGESAVKKLASTKKGTGKTKTQERLEELFGEAKERSNASAARLDELFGRANTKLIGVDKSINEFKEPVLKRLSMNLVDKLLQFVMSAPGLLTISFIAGFIKGKLEKWINDLIERWPWLKSLKEFFESDTAKKILTGGFVAIILNHLTGGLLGTLAKPLLGLLGKGIGAIITKGIPAIIKGGLGLVKGLAGMLTNPVGAIIATALVSIAAGACLFKKISDKHNEEEDKKFAKEKNVAKLDSNKSVVRDNAKNAKSLNEAINGSDTEIEITNDDGSVSTVRGHYDNGNFVVSSKYSKDKHDFVSLNDPYTIPKANLDSKEASDVDYSKLIHVTDHGVSRVNFQEMPASMKDSFAAAIDQRYGSELAEGMTGSVILDILGIFSDNVGQVAGEGMVQVKHSQMFGLIERRDTLGEEFLMGNIVNMLNRIVKQGFPYGVGAAVGINSSGASGLAQYYKVMATANASFGNTLGRYLPESQQEFASRIFKLRVTLGVEIENEGIVLNTKKTVHFEMPNWTAIILGILEFWTDVFFDFSNKKYDTDFKYNTVTKDEVASALKGNHGNVSHSTAIAVSALQDIRLKRAYGSSEYRNKRLDRVRALHQKSLENDGLTITDEEKEELKNAESEYKKYGKKYADEDSKTNSDLGDMFENIMDRLNSIENGVNESSENSKAASENSKRAERAGVASAVISANSAKKSKSSGHSADGNKVKPTGNR